MAEVLGSQWGGKNYGLNKHLIAKIYPVEADGIPVEGDVMVSAPLTDGNLEASFNWNSPFENTGTDSAFSSIAQLLQSGQAEPLLNLLAGAVGSVGLDSLKKNLDGAAEFAKTHKNRTGITQLNSRQVFTGMPPIKIPVTLYFRAWADPIDEVEKPINKLFEWALPQFLDRRSFVSRGADDFIKGDIDFNTFFPSTIPRFVALEYGGRTYKPLVIESIGQPLIMPRDSNGAMLSASIQLTLATLDAWDKNDYAVSLKQNRQVTP